MVQCAAKHTSEPDKRLSLWTPRLCGEISFLQLDFNILYCFRWLCQDLFKDE